MIGNPAISALNDQLYANDFTTARGAAEALAALIDTSIAVIPLLLDVVQTGPEQPRYAALCGLGSMLDHPIIREHWVALMQRATSESRRNALHILVCAGNFYGKRINGRIEPYISLLRAALNDPEIEVRQLAAGYLLQKFNLELLHEYMELLIDYPDLGIDVSGDCSLFLITASADILPQVWAFMHDPRPLMRANILSLLMEAPADIFGNVFLYGSKDPNTRVRERATTYLYKIKTKAAEEALLTALADPSATVRQTALITLGRKGDRIYLDAIRRATVDPVTNVRLTVANVIMHFKDQEGIAILEILIYDRSPYVRRQVTWVCARMQTPLAIPLLRSLAQDFAVPVRTGAASALVAIGTPDVLPILVLLARDVSVRVRLSVIQSLNVYSTFDRAMASTLVDMLADDVDEEVRAGVVEYHVSNKRV